MVVSAQGEAPFDTAQALQQRASGSKGTTPVRAGPPGAGWSTSTLRPHNVALMVAIGVAHDASGTTNHVDKAQPGPEYR